MLAVDTNILVRLITADDAKQTERAKALFLKHDQILIQSTVCLELEWVLRACYKLERDHIAKALVTLFGQPNVVFDEPNRLAKALQWFQTGLDFVDALHYAGAPNCDAFASFDRPLVAKASQIPEAASPAISA